jgi:cellulose synthase/poly-beta-1,6-N-acetylglucosamine synthase-like glycosyltransferase
MIETIMYSAILVISLVLTGQGIFTLYLMLYTWARPQRLATTCSPDMYRPPRLRFTALLPARHEQEVIAQTVHRVWEADYPKEFLEVVVICEQGDTETIAEARRAAAEIGHPNVWVQTFSDKPVNKQHGLNVGLRETSHEVITIFDSEDDVHPEIFQIVNAVMQRENANIVQAGVQLMDFQSSWYSIHNVLEYFFWFKSRLHFHARAGMVTLGGNTVFMKRDLIEAVGGWDEKCLTEDADIGIRLSVSGEQISVTYDAEHATREETPPTLKSFVKQRTRWNQGFLQVLKKNDWRRFPRLSQRAFALYTLTYPFVQAFVGLLWGIAILMMAFATVPVFLAMISLLPLYILVFQLVANLVGLFEFARVYQLRIRVRDLLVFMVGFMPYQMLLSFGAVRAIYREFRGMNNWEKTEHTGAHRHAEVDARQTTSGVHIRQAA